MGLLDWFKRRDVEPALTATDLAERLRAGDAAERAEAARRLGALGSDGWEAIGALTEALSDASKRVRLEAADALVKVGGDAVRGMETLTGLLEDPDASIRREAAGQIGRSGERAAPAAAALVRSLGDEDATVVAAGVSALLQIGQAAIPDLLPVLRSGPDGAPAGAAEAAARIAPVAIPTFIEMTDSQDPTERLIAALGLADLVPAEETLDLVLEALGSSDAFFRTWAARTIGLFGPEVEPRAAEPLRAALQDEAASVREAAAAALVKIRPGA